MKGFAFTPLLNNLTTEANQAELHPLAAYTRLLVEASRASLSADTYGSTSITSGGHSRIRDKKVQDIIASNIVTCHDMADELARHGQIDRSSIILPVDLGYIKHWQQSDYILFWLCVIAGPEFTDSDGIDVFASRLHHEIDARSVDLKLHNSSESNRVRAPEYFKFAQAFVQTVKQFEYQPLKRLIRMVDPDQSLGGQAERLAARLLDMPIYNVVSVDPSADPAKSLRNKRLIRDREIIIAYQGTLINAATQRMVVLEPEENTPKI